MVVFVVIAMLIHTRADAQVATPVVVNSVNPVPNHSLFELPFFWTGAAYPQPENYVSLAVTFLSPGGEVHNTVGMYEPPSLWRVVFFPDEVGIWTWYGVFTDGVTLLEYRGSFIVVETPTAIPRPSPAPTVISSSGNAESPQTISSVSRYSVLEIPFTWRSSTYPNSHEDVRVSAVFTSPSGAEVQIGGFHYAENDYRVRFSPTEIGNWTWRAHIGDLVQSRDYSGAFTVVEGESSGYVRRSTANPMRWVFDNGAAYYPVGITDCLLDQNRDNTPFNDMGLDGDPNAELETYLQRYGEAGFNLFRFSPTNCAFTLFDRIDTSGNLYRLQAGQWGDELVHTLREHGFRIQLVIFDAALPYPNAVNNPDEMAAVLRAVEYVVNRYGAYVDFWQLAGERAGASEAWVLRVVEHLRRVDPYDHPIGVSMEHANSALIDFVSLNWYERESSLESDLRTVQQIALQTSFGKPILFGEQGNAGQNWDENSARRMRLRLWTAFFNEAALILRNVSFAQDYTHPTAAGLYLGDEERASVRVLQDFAAAIDIHVRVEPVGLSQPEIARGYALRSDAMAAAYIVASLDQSNPISGLMVTLDVPLAGMAAWISPSTGEVIALGSVDAGVQTFTVPDFVTDIALMIR